MCFFHKSKGPKHILEFIKQSSHRKLSNTNQDLFIQVIAGGVVLVEGKNTSKNKIYLDLTRSDRKDGQLLHYETNEFVVVGKI